MWKPPPGGRTDFRVLRDIYFWSFEDERDHHTLLTIAYTFVLDEDKGREQEKTKGTERGNIGGERTRRRRKENTVVIGR